MDTRPFSAIVNLLSFMFRVLEKYYVGVLVDNEMPVYADDKYVQLTIIII